MTALISATSLSSDSGGRPIRFFGRSRTRSIRLERETSNHLRHGLHREPSFGGDGGSRGRFFRPRGVFERL